MTTVGVEDTTVVTATEQGPGAAVVTAEITMVCFCVDEVTVELDTSLETAA